MYGFGNTEKQNMVGKSVQTFYYYENSIVGTL